VAELPIRPLAGPREQTVPKTDQARFHQYIQSFKELIRAVATAKPVPASANGPVIPAADSEPAGSVDRSARRAIPATAEAGESAGGPSAGGRFAADTAETERAQPAAALEPFAVLLESLGAFSATAAESRAAPLPERLASEIVRTIAWGGDRRRGAARIELGGERFGGTKVTVEVDGDRLRLGLDAPPGVDSVELRQRLTARLERRGLSVEEA
jgi:hypothetical protein